MDFENCHESRYHGTIVDVTTNGRYIIEADDGTRHDDWDSSMHRTQEATRR